MIEKHVILLMMAGNYDPKRIINWYEYHSYSFDLIQNYLDL